LVAQTCAGAAAATLANASAAQAAAAPARPAFPSSRGAGRPRVPEEPPPPPPQGIGMRAPPAPAAAPQPVVVGVGMPSPSALQARRAVHTVPISAESSLSSLNAAVTPPPPPPPVPPGPLPPSDVPLPQQHGWPSTQAAGTPLGPPQPQPQQRQGALRQTMRSRPREVAVGPAVPAVQATTTQAASLSDAQEFPPFDCVVDFAQWGARWSRFKKDWCCGHLGRGCYLKVSTGNCEGYGMQPIRDSVTCQEASHDAGLKHQQVQATDRDPNRPEGCYELHNLQDGSWSLWLNTNPASKGKGAETSDQTTGEYRQPLCSTASGPPPSPGRQPHFAGRRK